MRQWDSKSENLQKKSFWPKINWPTSAHFQKLFVWNHANLKLAIFEILNGNNGQTVMNIANFFVTFVQNDVLYNLVEFKSDRMRPRVSAKNGQIDAHGLIAIFFFSILTQNFSYPKTTMKITLWKNFMALQ